MVSTTLARVLIYGSRTWTEGDVIREVLSDLPADTVIIHGGAAGADSMAGAIAREFGYMVVVFPADWKTYGRSAGHRRNQQMIDQGKPDEAVGFRSPGESRGTDNMTSLLVKAGIPHVVVM
jgi:hypothetical protein